MTIAIAHKDYDVRGGGEVLAEHLAETFDAPLFIGGRRHPDREPEDIDIDIREFMGPKTQWVTEQGGFTRSVGHAFGWLTQSSDLAEFDVVITSGNEPMWYRPPDRQAHVSYCHSPPRWMFDLFHKHGDTVGDHIAQLINFSQSVLYDHTAHWPDIWVANSDLVARRITRYRGVDEEDVRVVYPPVETGSFDRRLSESADYYVTLSRLDGPKRIDEIVRAFNDLGPEFPLVVAGRGPEEERLREMAEDHIEFTGFVSEEKKRELLAGARAFIFAAENEDFGMAPVEAFASGTPVIGVEDGFTRYQVVKEKNGLTFERGNLAETVEQFDRSGVDWSDRRIEQFAERFSVEMFRSGMREAVQEARRRAEVSTDWDDLRGGVDLSAADVQDALTDGGDIDG